MDWKKFYTFGLSLVHLQEQIFCGSCTLQPVFNATLNLAFRFSILHLPYILKEKLDCMLTMPFVRLFIDLLSSLIFFLLIFILQVLFMLFDKVTEIFFQFAGHLGFPSCNFIPEFFSLASSAIIRKFNLIYLFFLFLPPGFFFY